MNFSNPFKIFFLSCLCTVTLYSNSVYDTNILNLQAKVFPKIVMADKQLEDKTTLKTIYFTILYDEIDLNIALKFKKMVMQNYQNLNEYQVSVNLLNYQDFVPNKKLSTAYFFLLGDEKEIQSVATNITENGRLSFCYNNEYLDYGILFGLEVTSKVSLNLNINQLKKSKIELENSILKVVKIK